MKKFLLFLLFILPLQAHAVLMCDGMWKDHTKFQLVNPHDQNKCTCTACHLNGVFTPGGAGGGATCNSCHLGSRPTAKQKPANHIKTLADCIQCHRLAATFEGGQMDHTGISTGCASCHTKPGTHPDVATTTCESCHSTTGWKCGS